MAGEGTARRAVNRVRHMVAEAGVLRTAAEAVGVHRMVAAEAAADLTAVVVAARVEAVVAVEAAAAAVDRAAVAADIPVVRTKTPFVAVRTRPCRD